MAKTDEPTGQERMTRRRREVKELTLQDMPPVPAGAPFSLQRVEKITMPHPFCISVGHVAYAADHCSGMLSTDAIKRSNVPCGVRGCQLSIDQHETSVTLFILVPQNHDLNAIEGLHKYLFENKPRFLELGIEGFAFPTK